MLRSRYVLESDTKDPELPFLWKSVNGCVYLRTVGGSDVIIVPRIQDGKTGRVVAAALTDDAAWTLRLPKGSTVTLTVE